MTPVLKGFIAGVIVGLIVWFIASLIPLLAGYSAIIGLIAFGATWYTVYVRSGGTTIL